MRYGLKVGVSIFATPTAHIWSSGINQNIAFLLELLRGIPEISQVWLLNGGDASELPPLLAFDGLGVPLVRPHDVTHDIDVVIEAGAVLPADWMRRVRARGARSFRFLMGHPFVAIAEPAVFGKSGTAPFRENPVDEVWILPQHEKTSAPLLRTLSGAPVVVVPHLWSPTFLHRDIERCEQAFAGRRFGFDPATRVRQPWSMGIFEPNISVVKSCFIPMLACEHFYRLHPERVGVMRVMNSFHMKDHQTFNRFASNLDITRESKASYEPRISFAEAMLSQSIDAVVTHHWECGLNYLYYDALYGGYPLIHNSDMLRDAGVGFHYPGFAATEGGRALNDAWRQPADFWADYQRGARAFLNSLSPKASANVAAFAQRLNTYLLQDQSAA